MSAELFERTAGYNVSMTGWGGEDVDFFERAVAALGPEAVVRAPDPGVVHHWHDKKCEDELDVDCALATMVWEAHPNALVLELQRLRKQLRGRSRE